MQGRIWNFHFLSGLHETFPRRVQRKVWLHPPKLWWAEDFWWGGTHALPQCLHLQQHQDKQGGFTNVYHHGLSLFSRLRPAWQPVWKYHARLQRSFMVSLNWRKGTTQRGRLTPVYLHTYVQTLDVVILLDVLLYFHLDRLEIRFSYLSIHRCNIFSCLCQICLVAVVYFYWYDLAQIGNQPTPKLS